MAIAQIAVLVQLFEWLDRVLIDSFQILQNDVGNLIDGRLFFVRLIVQSQQFGDMSAIPQIRRYREFLLISKKKLFCNLYIFLFFFFIP